MIYNCVCGKSFESRYSYIGHCCHCEQHLGHSPTDNFGEHRYVPKSKPNKDKLRCRQCGQTFSRKRDSGLCYKCSIKKKQGEKIEHWLETGDIGVSVGTIIRGCYREYIQQEQNNTCAICGCSNIWNGQELKFVLDHIDGNAANNERNNLRLICSNCDSQLPTYKSKNKNSARQHRRTS